MIKLKFKIRQSSIFGIALGATCSAGLAQSLIGCTPPTGMPTEDFVCLDDYSTLQDLVYRAIGRVNFSTTIESSFVPFPLNGPIDPHSGFYTDTAFRKPYGDRLGYEASGLFDVDGDGFNDWSTTWYDAQPVDGLTNTPRVPIDAYVIPVVSALQTNPSHAQTAAELRTKSTWNKVGMCRVFSGRDNSQIGQEIWSHKNGAIAPHEIGPLRDIDGDGRDELVLSANTFDGNRGSVNVMSFTNKYNSPGDLTERWVCIMKIVGQNSSSEFAYELEDTQSDFNNDGQHDIVAASTFWRMAGSDRAATKTGAGWIFLTPPEQVFIDLQNSTTWATDPLRNNVKMPIELIAEQDYNLCVMQLDDATGMPIDLHNDVPANADSLRVGSIGDLADAGDIDGDGHTDFSVFGFYRYDDNGVDVTTGAVYFMLSDDGFGPTGYTLHDKQSRVIGISGVDTLVPDPNYIGVAIDVYQDAEVVFHGDHERGYANNQRSYFGLTLDGAGDSDMALAHYKSGNLGEVQVLLDGQTTPRFNPTGSIGSLIPTDPLQRPLALFYDDPIISPDHLFTGHQLYASDGVTPISLGNITGIELAGNFDGIGDQDCEISITTITGYKLGTGNPNYSLISLSSVIEIPPVGSVPLVLKSIQHETPIYHSINNPLTGLNYGSAGMHYRGLKAQAAWDQDGDGRDDLIVHTAATPAPILSAPDPAGSTTPVMLFDVDPSSSFFGYRPYHVEGQAEVNGLGAGAGSTHVLLSPANQPERIGGTSRVWLSPPPGQSEVRITLNVDKISPEINPNNTNIDSESTFTRGFDHNEFIIELVDPLTDVIHDTQTVQATPLEILERQAPRRLSFTMPLIGTVSEMQAMHLRIHTRWKDSNSEPWVTYLPAIRGPLIGGNLAP